MRKAYLHNDSMWFLRRDYAHVQKRVEWQIHSATYQFSLVKKVTINDHIKSLMTGPDHKTIKFTNQLLNTWEAEKHPEKTYIGRSKNGFDFLGVHIIHHLYIQQYIDRVKIWTRGVLNQIRCLKVDLRYETNSGSTFFLHGETV